MSKNKSKKKNTGSPPISVRLSQCMIVKNEEKNIERALSWAKGITIEQIVVDTGSNDRTVEIAKKMGAKVLHFTWINDFAAAKNYALAQATGNWIAFLDADEFFSPEDAKKLMANIRQVQTNPQLRTNYLAIGCSLYNVDDSGKITSIIEQARIFKNNRQVRYRGRIHEGLTIDQSSIIWTEEIKIIHAASKENRLEAGKWERNIDLLRVELAEDPENLSYKAYLADSLKGSGDEKNLAEAESLYAEVVESGAGSLVYPELKRKAYAYFMNKYTSDPAMFRECEEICRKGLAEFPDLLDFEYFYAYSLNNKGDYAAAWELLVKCEARLEQETNLAVSVYVSADPTLLYVQMALAAQGLGDVKSVIKYITLILSADKTRTSALCPYITTLIKNGASTYELASLLGSIYDMNDPGDLLIIARAAKECGAIELASLITKNAKEILGN